MMPLLLRPFACLVAAVVLVGTLGLKTRAPIVRAHTAIEAGAQIPRAPRLVAIGDLHADVDASRRAFRLAGAIDERDAWIGGKLVMVQMGDLIGRGSEDLGILDFILAVREKAAAAGGTVHVLIGNHEVFAARPDHRWVHPGAFAAFTALGGLNLKHPRLADVPVTERARAAALMPGGPYAKQLSAFPAVLRVGDTIFAHGGVLPMWARYGIDRINGEVSAWLAGRRADEPASTLGLDDGSADDGVMWSRHFAAAPEEMACALGKESLSILGARRMVIAHTVQKVITSRCDEQIWAIDVGISRYYGGELQVLEILDGTRVTVIGR